MGCVKLGNKFAFCSPTAGRRTQINYAISPNPWEIIFPAPVVSTFHLSSPLENDVPLVENNPNIAPDQNGASKQPKQGDLDLGAPR